MPTLVPQIATNDPSLLLYAELDEAAIRTAQRRLKAGTLLRILPGVASASPPEQWPAIFARERLRVLAALFPQSVLAYRSAFNGGLPENGEIHLTLRRPR